MACRIPYMRSANENGNGIPVNRIPFYEIPFALFPLSQICLPPLIPLNTRRFWVVPYHLLNAKEFWRCSVNSVKCQRILGEGSVNSIKHLRVLKVLH